MSKDLEQFSNDDLANELKKRRLQRQQEKEAEIKALAKQFVTLKDAFEKVIGEKIEKFRGF